MTERTIGYLLLIVGILIMIFATFQIIAIFTGRANPIALFQYEETSKKQNSEGIDVNSIISQLQNNGQSSEINLGSTPRVNIIDPQLLNQILNLALYYLIMQFLLGLGFKFATLGTQLVRPIHVNLKTKSDLSEVNKSQT